jgi:hypothetical protein
MFITKKHIDRRTFLRGAGVTLALPLLDSMLPAQTPLSQTAANPSAANTRFLGIFAPHGWARLPDNTGFWVPSTAGKGFEMPPTLTPMTPYRDQMIIFSGWDSTGAMPPPGSSGGDHSRASCALTGVNPKKTGGSDLYGGVSIDQILAQTYGKDSLLPSLPMGIEDPGSNTGICGWGYSCAYSNSVSWSAPAKPLPQEINPQVVFERLFGDGSSPEERVARKKENGSILDNITRKVSKLQTNLPSSDKERLGGYLEDVREIERRLQLAAKASADVPSIDVPFGVPESFDDHIKLMFDLLAVAWQSNITKYATLMIARDVSLRSYPESGVDTVNHSCSHHGEDDKRRLDYGKMNRYHLSTMAYFAKKLKTIQDGDGNLLDHSLLLWTSNMGNGNQHNHNNVAHLMLGGASGALKGKGDMHMKAPEPTPAANILLSTLHLFGVDKQSIGDSTGVAL